MFEPKKKEYLLTIVNILKRVSELDIYEKFLNQTIYLNVPILNTIRQEKNPSLVISYKDSHYLHLDYGNSYYRGNCFQLVQQKYNCNFSKALEIIDSEFNLGLLSNTPINEKYEVENITIYKPIPDKIKFNYRKTWSKNMQKYWNDYFLEERYLKSKNVFEVSNFYINDTIINYEGIAIAYYISEIDKTKIYLPISKYLGKKQKFYSDIPFDYLYKDNIKTDNRTSPIIVCKSRKDELILSLYTQKATSVQAENYYCFNEKNINYLNSVSDKIYINFGSDKQGKEESIKITQAFGYKHLNTPDTYLKDGVNDMAELQKVYGPKIVEEFLKSKNIV